MGRGILSGVFWGGAISIVALWMVSQLGGMIHLLSTPPSNVVSEAPAAATSETEASDPDLDVPAEAGRPATDPSRSGATLDTGTPEALPTADTASADVPETGAVGAAPTEPAVGSTPTVDAVSEEPAVPSLELAAPAQPIIEENPVAAEGVPMPQTAEVTELMPAAPEMPGVDAEGRPAADDSPVPFAEPAQPAAPAEDESPAAAESPVEVVAEPAEVVVEEPVVVEEDVQVVAPEPEAAVEVAEAPSIADPAPKPESQPELVTAGQTAEAPTPEATPQPEVVAEPVTEPEVVTEAVTEPEAVVVKETPQETEVAELPATQELPAPEQQAEATQAGDLESDAEIGNLAPNVKTNRLPTIGADVTEEPEIETAEVEAAPTEGPAIEANAVAFDNPEQRPVMAIVLFHEEGGPAPQEFPFPVSYVVDASASDAAAQMEGYRKAGHEVVAMAPLPARATPSDVEVSFETYKTTMTGVVAFMDTREAAFQSGRLVATQVAESLAAQGLGMITYNRGLNSATQVAERQGVPAKLVFREFDNDGQDKATIQRFLDQAAFKAGQQSGVILVGHNRPETIAAIIEWGLGNRAATVALAPVSVALLAE